MGELNRSAKMIRATILLFLLILTSVGFSSTSQTQLIVQPIIGHGEAESWNGDSYRIVDVPYLKEYFQGHPAYEGIAQTNSILTDAPRSERQPESNLLALMGISIRYDFASSTVWLDMTNAQELEGWPITVQEGGFVALECIRMVAYRYEHKPKVAIRSKDEDKDFWANIEKRFAKHNLSQQFNAEQGAAPNP